MIATQDRILARVAEWRRQSRTVGFTNGIFDVLHLGHVATLAYAGHHCDRLIVAINDDAGATVIKGWGRPLNPENDRAAVVDAIKYVSAVVIFRLDELDRLIADIRPDILVKGAEYRDKPVIGADHAKQVMFAPMIPGRSTTDLIGRLSCVAS